MAACTKGQLIVMQRLGNAARESGDAAVHRFAAVGDRYGTSNAIIDGHVRVDAEQVGDRGDEVGGPHQMTHRVSRVWICRANHDSRVVQAVWVCSITSCPALP